ALLPDVQRIAAAGRHLLSLINNILDLSKIEAGEMEIVRERVELASLLEDTVDTAQPLADRNRNKLELNVETRVAAFESDRTRILQILLNLVGNACKFTENGIVAIDVRDGDGQRLELRVRDNGPGIAPERIGHLFEPFSQLESTRKGEGTGLGLTISRHLCQLLGGTINVESHLGEGTVFSITIPLSHAEINP
ncbi:MAG: hypothetical protein KC609_21085, partial [Myxococcales bacterium]|nr:hypothetical protein [Myxococcales bacterium]